MNIVMLESATAFFDRVSPLLMANEAANNLLLGLATELIANPQLFGSEPPLYLVVEEGGAPVAAALRTPPHPLALSLIAPPERDLALVALAAWAATHMPALPAISGPIDSAQGFAQRWVVRQGGTLHVKMYLRIFELTTVIWPAQVDGQLRRATTADQALVIAWIQGFQADTSEQPINAEQVRMAAQRWLHSDSRALYFWEVAGKPVSMAGYAGPTPSGMRVSLVYTPREQRGHGYASACVARLSQLLLDSGRRACFLYTDLANPTSNKIYQQIGYRMVCDAAEIALVPV